MSYLKKDNKEGYKPKNGLTMMVAGGLFLGIMGYAVVLLLLCGINLSEGVMNFGCWILLFSGLMMEDGLSSMNLSDYGKKRWRLTGKILMVFGGICILPLVVLGESMSERLIILPMIMVGALLTISKYQDRSAYGGMW